MLNKIKMASRHSKGKKMKSYCLKLTYRVYTSSDISRSWRTQQRGIVLMEFSCSGNASRLYYICSCPCNGNDNAHRFASEERTNGVLKALSYRNKMSLRNLSLWLGFSFQLGTVIGSLLGTYFLPYILGERDFKTLQFIQHWWLDFYWGISSLLVCSVLCGVVPALYMLTKSWKKTIQLLLPAAPTKGFQNLC